MKTKSDGLPAGWMVAQMNDVAEINPSRSSVLLADDAQLSFVPMAAVEAGTGKIVSATVRRWGEVKRGYTTFQDQDVLFAKITPCMENGKVALASNLVGGRGAGSTEFHVLRPAGIVDPKYLLHFLLRETFRQNAKAHMAGAVGQLRVPERFMASSEIAIAPIPEQHRIVAEIEKHLTRLDAVVAALQRVRASLKRYRAAVLKAACEGRLVPTEAEMARQEGRDYEPADALLKRILRERRAKWEADQLDKMRKQGKVPKDDRWKAAYEEPTGPDTSGLPDLPPGWSRATMDQSIARSEYGTSVKCSYEATGIGVLRIPNIAAGEVSQVDMKFATQALQLDQQDMLQVGDLLMCRTNGSIGLIGKTALVRSPLSPPRTFASYLLRFRLVETGILPRWIHLYTATPQGRAFIERNAASSAGQHNISLTLIHSMPFPLPPLVEQHRIVAEVERRFSVVDTLEQAAEANLHRAGRLRQSILKRAFEGKLVPQDPNDEPASALLERIRAERNGASPPREAITRPRPKAQQVQMTL